MPNTASAKKALRQNEKRRTQNLSVRRMVRKTIKEYKALVEGGRREEALQKLSDVYKILDKAAGEGVIKKNKASRLKSRLSAKLKSDSGAGPREDVSSGAEGKA